MPVRPILTAWILPGSKPIGEGLFGCRKGNIYTSDNRTFIAYFKPLEYGNPFCFFAEFYSAKLAEALNLNIPECFLAVDSETGKYHFALKAIDKPSLFHYAETCSTDNEQINNITFELLNEFINSCSQNSEIIAFDELISNIDRHLNNFLWDGGSEYYLIDHGLSLREIPSPQNKLLNLELSLPLSPQKINSIFTKGLNFLQRVTDQDIDEVNNTIQKINFPYLSQESERISQQLKASKTIITNQFSNRKPNSRNTMSSLFQGNPSHV